MAGTIALLLALAFPLFLLGYLRSLKVGASLAALCLLTAAYYEWFDGATGPAAEEWGAKFAPVFFFVLGSAFICALMTGWLAGLIVKKIRKNRDTRNGEIAG